jgi:hypothetical protein
MSGDRLTAEIEALLRIGMCWREDKLAACELCQRKLDAIESLKQFVRKSELRPVLGGIRMDGEDMMPVEDGNP